MRLAAVGCGVVDPTATSPRQGRSGSPHHRGGQAFPHVGCCRLPHAVGVGGVGVRRFGNVRGCHALLHGQGQLRQGFSRLGPRYGAAEDSPPPVHDQSGESCCVVVGHGPVSVGV